MLTKLAPDQANPLDAVEQMAVGHSWPFERASEDEIALVVDGRCTNYQISFTWMHEIEVLHVACAFDMKVPEMRLSDVRQLIALIIEDLWIGHFDVWTRSGMIMFRYALILADGIGASVRQCEAMLGAAFEFERALLPGTPIRGLGWQVRSRGDGLRDA